MEKLKPYLRIAAFVLVFVLVLRGLSWLAKPDFPDVKDVAGFYGEAENTLDVIYLGGSAAFVYYAPLTAWEEFGISSYVYGANTIQPELYETLIREALKTQQPKLLVLDARCFQYRDRQNPDAQPPAEVPYRNTLNGLRLSWNKIRFIDRYVGSVIRDKKLPYYLDLIKFHQNIPDCPEDNLQMLFGSYQHPYSGFHFVQKWDAIPRYDFSTTEAAPVSTETETILNELLDYLDSTGIDCAFVVSPYAEKPEHKAIYNYVAPIIEAHGYAFVDFNEQTDEMGLDHASDFYNEGHVTVFGAEKYTRYLSAWLMEQYAIPDRRGDPACAGLEARLPAWHAALEETKAAIEAIKEAKTHAG